MSGHSKWATTKHKKAVVDARRGKLFAKLIKNVEVAARTGGADPAGNPTLYDAVQKAKKSSVPNDNIDRAVRRGAGLEAGGAQYEQITYEGYAPGGVAVLVECLTDNRNRAASDVRTAFSRNGGSMADPGSVAYLFHRKGVVLVAKAVGATEDDVLAAVLDAGAEEVNDLGESLEVISEPTDLHAVRSAVSGAGIDYESAETPFLPTVEVELDEEQAKRVFRLIEALEDSDDVQDVYANYSVPDAVLEKLGVSIEIRPVTADDDFGAELDLATRAFGPVSAADRQMRLDRVARAAADGRVLGAFDGGRMVASGLYHQMRQWWHGRDLPMAGVASVKVAPEDRSRGVGRALMAELLALAAAGGNVVSALYPATLTLYRSLGWEIAGAHYELTVPARTLRRLSGPDELISAGATGDPAPPLRRPGPADAEEVIAVIDRVSADSRDCGPATCADFVHRELANPDVFRVLAPDGYLAYEWARDGAEVSVRRLIAGTPASARALWGVIASHGTIAGTVRATTSPAGPLTWLAAQPDIRVRTTFPWMLRLLSAAEAVAGRGFSPAVTLSVPLELADPQLPGNAGSWRLEVAGGAGALKPAAGPDPAALRLGPRGFAALYGGVPVLALRQAGLAAGGAPGTDAGLDAAFGASAYLLDEF